MSKDELIPFTSIKIASWVIAICSIIIFGSVPIVQLVKERSSGEPLQEFDVFKQAPSVANLRLYENELEDNSVISQAIQPWYQLLSTRLANQGNPEAVIGKDGWLFYRPSLDYIINPGSNFHRDLGPMPAMLSFHESLKAQGVDLILLPVPGKATIYPEYLSGRYDTELGPPVNPYAPRFFQLLREKGVHVIDPANTLWEAKDNGPVYMLQDTHWSPSGMKLAARLLAGAIQDGGWLTDAPQKSYRVQEVEVERLGDIHDMLNLPEDKTGGFKPMNIMIEKVVEAETDEPYLPDTNSPIVLLGDSFVNVFSKGHMGWGEYAGLAEHLALQLSAPVDVIAINDGGPTTSRESLARRPNALVGKKLVIWQFATRDLVNPESEWKIVNIPKPRIDPEAVETKHDSSSLVVFGELTTVSMVPDPSQVAYSECVTYVKYRVISVEQGEYEDVELLAVHWGMRDSKLMPAAQFQIGEKHRLSLDLFEDHEELSHIMQADDTDDYEHTPFWVLEMSPL